MDIIERALTVAELKTELDKYPDEDKVFVPRRGKDLFMPAEKTRRHIDGGVIYILSDED